MASASERRTPPHERREGVIISFVLGFLLVAASSAWGAESFGDRRMAPLSSLTVGALAENREMADAFMAWRAALDAGAADRIFAQSSRMASVKEALGTRNLTALADMVIVEGRRALAEGALQRAVNAAEQGVMFAPDYPAAHFFLAEALFATDRTNVKPIITSLAEGAQALLTDKIRAVQFTATLAGRAFIVSLVAFLFVFLALIGANHKAMIADIAAFFPSSTRSIGKLIIPLLVFVAPFALGGWLLFLLTIPLFLWPYAKRGGRVASFLFVALILTAPQLFEFMARGLSLTDADTYRALYLLTEETWDYSTKRTLESEAKHSPNDHTVLFALGLLNKMRGEKEEAVRYYDRLLAKDPRDVRVMVNKGNAYFITRNFKQAAAIYRQAIAIDKTSLEAHFNLSTTYVELFNTKESEAEYKAAMNLDPERTTLFLANAARGDRQKVVDFPLTKADLARFESAQIKRTAAISSALWTIYLGGIAEKTYRNVAFGFLFLLVLSGLVWERRISHQVCSFCGSPFRPPVRLGSDHPKCNQCVAAQLGSRGGLSSAKKDKKRREMREYQERHSRLASILDRLFPGVGRAYFNYPLRGLFFSFGAAYFIVTGFILFGDEMSAPLDPMRMALDHPFFWGGTALYWFTMNTALTKDFN